MEREREAADERLTESVSGWVSACLKASVRLTSIASGGSSRRKRKKGTVCLVTWQANWEIWNKCIKIKIITSFLSKIFLRVKLDDLALGSCIPKHHARLARSWFSRAWREEEEGEKRVREGGMGFESWLATIWCRERNASEGGSGQIGERKTIH